MPIVSGGSGGGGGQSGTSPSAVSASLGVAGPRLTLSPLAPTALRAILVVYGKMQSTRAQVSDGLLITFNNDTTSGHYGAGSGGGGGGGFGTAFTLLMPGTAAGINVNGGGFFWIMNPADASNNVPVFGMTGGRIGNSGVAGDFNNPADWNGQYQNGPVTRIDFVPGTGPNFNAGAYAAAYYYS